MTRTRPEVLSFSDISSRRPRKGRSGDEGEMPTPNCFRSDIVSVADRRGETMFFLLSNFRAVNVFGDVPVRYS